MSETKSIWPLYGFCVLLALAMIWVAVEQTHIGREVAGVAARVGNLEARPIAAPPAPAPMPEPEPEPEPEPGPPPGPEVLAAQRRAAELAAGHVAEKFPNLDMEIHDAANTGGPGDWAFLVGEPDGTEDPITRTVFVRGGELEPALYHESRFRWLTLGLEDLARWYVFEDGIGSFDRCEIESARLIGPGSLDAVARDPATGYRVAFVVEDYEVTESEFLE